MNTQIQEMNNFQQSLSDLERAQQTIKDQYVFFAGGFGLFSIARISSVCYFRV